MGSWLWSKVLDLFGKYFQDAAEKGAVDMLSVPIESGSSVDLSGEV